MPFVHQPLQKEKNPTGIKGREQDEDEKDETLVDVEEKKMTLPESIIILATLLLAFNLSQFCRNAVLR